MTNPTRAAANLGAVKRTYVAVTAWLTVLATVVAIAGCSRAAVTAEPVKAAKPGSEFADALSKRVTTDAMFAHLTQLQDIANANSGTRTVGTPGFVASFD